MLEAIKSILGITSNVFNDEIVMNIEAAFADMEATTDIDYREQTDPLIFKAVSTYCAWQHNLMHGNAEISEKYKRAYVDQKKALLMSGKYTNFGS